MAEIMNQFRRFHFVCFRNTPWLKTGHEEHLLILEAICRRDAKAAGDAMQQHITTGAERGPQVFMGAFVGGKSV
jgi:DNA-binding GntR family transcriptional regulator